MLYNISISLFFSFIVFIFAFVMVAGFWWKGEKKCFYWRSPFFYKQMEEEFNIDELRGASGMTDEEQEQLLQAHEYFTNQDRIYE